MTNIREVYFEYPFVAFLGSRFRLELLQLFMERSGFSATSIQFIGYFKNLNFSHIIRFL